MTSLVSGKVMRSHSCLEHWYVFFYAFPQPRNKNHTSTRRILLLSSDYSAKTRKSWERLRLRPVLSQCLWSWSREKLSTVCQSPAFEMTSTHLSSILIDQGSLRVTLQTGHDLRAVDRGGKSDPYAVFTLNGERVFKSQVKKKTVNPEWHEIFNITVVSIRNW
jgi:C2 domain